MLLLKAFALVRLHFFSAAAAAVFDVIDVRVLFLLGLKADPLRKNGRPKTRRILLKMKLQERKNL